jgi:hypothetical protein
MEKVKCIFLRMTVYASIDLNVIAVPGRIEPGGASTGPPTNVAAVSPLSPRRPPRLGPAALTLPKAVPVRTSSNTSRPLTVNCCILPTNDLTAGCEDAAALFLANHDKYKAVMACRVYHKCAQSGAKYSAYRYTPKKIICQL